MKIERQMPSKEEARTFMNSAVKTAALAVCLNLVLAARLIAGPPFLTDDPEPVDYQHWEAYLFTLGDHSGSYTVEGPAVELNYGVLPDTQLHLIVPMTTVGGGGVPPQPDWATPSSASNTGSCMKRTAGRKSGFSRWLNSPPAMRVADWATDRPGFNCPCGCKKAGGRGRLTAVAARF